MKKDVFEQIQKKEINELRHSVDEMKERLSRAQFDLKSGKTTVLKEIHDLKKSIAIHLTILGEKSKK